MSPHRPDRRAAPVVGSFLAALALAGLIPPPPAQAQTPGTAIRVATTAEPKQWITGRYAAGTADSLAIIASVRKARPPVQGSPLSGSAPATAAMTADTLWLARGDIHRMQVSHGRKSGAGRGALVGAGVGLGMGLLLFTGAMTSSECDGEEGLCAAAAGVVGAGLAATGAGLGALIGTASSRERWESVPVTPSVGMGRERDVRIGLAFNF